MTADVKATVSAGMSTKVATVPAAVLGKNRRGEQCACEQHCAASDHSKEGLGRHVLSSFRLSSQNRLPLNRSREGQPDETS